MKNKILGWLGTGIQIDNDCSAYSLQLPDDQLKCVNDKEDLEYMVR